MTLLRDPVSRHSQTFTPRACRIITDMTGVLEEQRIGWLQGVGGDHTGYFVRFLLETQTISLSIEF